MGRNVGYAAGFTRFDWHSYDFQQGFFKFCYLNKKILSGSVKQWMMNLNCKIK